MLLLLVRRKKRVTARLTDLPKVKYQINERKPRIPTWKPQTTRLNVRSVENIGKSTASMGNEEGGIYPMGEVLDLVYFLFSSLFDLYGVLI